MPKLQADYLVIGTGAVSMAFVDVMLDETDATFVMVDRHHMPGGHWNDAYPFVRLHQPSAFYGVSSLPLGADRIDEDGPNKGYFELASGAEVLAYYEKVMRERFLPSGRVRYFPMSDYKGGGVFQSLLSDETHEVTIGKRTVDGTFFNTSVPSTHNRKFAVADGVSCITPNLLPREAEKYRRFTIVGAGKTGMDAAVWLLNSGVDPDAVSWVMPRDSWLVNRDGTQPDVRFFKNSIGGFMDQMEACGAANDVDDLFDRLEACGAMLRIDAERRPTMFHYATISQGEIEQLRSIKNVLRQGRVERIEADQIVFQNGETSAADMETLYVDCSATAVQFSTEQSTVFKEGLITLQSVRTPLLPFSAAVIAYLEAHYETDEERNRLSTPVILADTPAEWMQSMVGNLQNQFLWSQEKELSNWLTDNRLDPFGKVIRDVEKTPDNAEILKRVRDAMMPGVMNLQKLIGEAD
ncbi:MAG: NAD(P)/FAD-dependent oxidoreductase [Pseudomonadota bacterium]